MAVGKMEFFSLMILGLILWYLRPEGRSVRSLKMEAAFLWTLQRGQWRSVESSPQFLPLICSGAAFLLQHRVKSDVPGTDIFMDKNETMLVMHNHAINTTTNIIILFGYAPLICWYRCVQLL